ncbi:MAG TPA: BON domain-containing protein [Burkholderiales bacterium]
MKTPKSTCALLLAAALLGLAGCASTGGGDSFFDEAATTMRVKQAIYNDPSLKVMDISVTTEDGVVTLNGTVKNRGQGVKAVQVARKVEGVKRVRNELKVGK